MTSIIPVVVDGFDFYNSKSDLWEKIIAVNVGYINSPGWLDVLLVDASMADYPECTVRTDSPTGGSQT